MSLKKHINFFCIDLKSISYFLSPFLPILFPSNFPKIEHSLKMQSIHGQPKHIYLVQSTKGHKH